MNKLDKKIQEYLKDKDIIDALCDATDLFTRLELNQEGNVKDILDKWKEDGFIGKSIKSPMYKAIELAEYLKCKYLWGDCKYVDTCWVTRRGWCQKRKEMKENNG